MTWRPLQRDVERAMVAFSTCMSALMSMLIHGLLALAGAVQGSPVITMFVAVILGLVFSAIAAYVRRVIVHRFYFGRVFSTPFGKMRVIEYTYGAPRVGLSSPDVGIRTEILWMTSDEFHRVAVPPETR